MFTGPGYSYNVNLLKILAFITKGLILGREGDNHVMSH